ncbi:MAG: phosphopantothenoylcysteine decarboxylase, partial [Bacteriovoracaceae bacterium]
STDDFNIQKRFSNHSSQINHIDLAKWTDQFIIAPASANVIAKCALGIADDLLTTTYLSLEHKQVVICPAMNVVMLNQKILQKHLNELKGRAHHTIFPTDFGLLACGDVGLGKLPKIEKIALITETLGTVAEKVAAKTVKSFLITTGATLSPLDPIRYLTNASSGVTGLILAKYLLQKGHNVTVLAGVQAVAELDDLTMLPHFKLERAVTTSDLFQLVKKHLKHCDHFIAAAAPVDYEFAFQKEKIKKEQMSLPKSTLAPDILAYVLKNRSKTQKVVGFAAETTINQTILNEKWQRKKVDLLIGNSVHHGFSEKAVTETKGFGKNGGEYTFFAAGKIGSTKSLTKLELAESIYNFCMQ